MHIKQKPLENTTMKRFCTLCLILLSVAAGVRAQEAITLEQCREMAVNGNKSLDQARLKIKMARYDRNTAVANYFPKISAKAAYFYNDRHVQLISDDLSNRLSNMGTTVQNTVNATGAELIRSIMNNPAALQEFSSSPMWQTVASSLGSMDLSEGLNALGAEINDALTLDIQHMYGGLISVQQPVFVGGKIIASNQMAALALELSETQFDAQYQDVLLAVDQAYWQVVSVANKQKLAAGFNSLMKTALKNVEIAVAEGTATEADALQIKVRANEAAMLLTKAQNGLVLSRMLLCKQIGLPLDSAIVLADENLDKIPVPACSERKDMSDVFSDRPETRSLDLASQIYDRKVAIARADMMPKIALTANYLITNPSLSDGFQHEFSGRFMAGVVMDIPILHGTEALQKKNKAKAEAELYRVQYNDACDLITLQVEQLRRQQKEDIERVKTARSNLANAEENLRIANLGFTEGQIPVTTLLAAQTAWLQAHSESIDAGIALQIDNASLLKAEGQYR